MHLDIHLNCSNANLCTSYLKVHIAQEVFHPLNIGQNRHLAGSVFLYSFNQAHGNTCNWSLDWNPCIHQCQTGTASGTHGSGTVGLKGFRYGTDRVRELIHGRQYRQKRSLGQRAMPDLSSSGSSAHLRLAYGIGREIVVMHISLGRNVLIQSVHLLHLGKGRQCADITDLGLSSGKHGRTMHARNQVYLSCQRAYLLHVTSVRSLMVF